MGHSFCISLYKATCDEYQVAFRSMNVYRYQRLGNNPQFQVYYGNKVLGDYSGCCGWSANADALNDCKHHRDDGLFRG